MAAGPHALHRLLHADESLTTDPPREVGSATSYRFDPARESRVVLPIVPIETMTAAAG